MSLRKAHGTGKKTRLRSELPPLDEIKRPVTPSCTEPPGRGKDGKFLPQNRESAKRRLRPNKFGAILASEPAAEFAPYVRWSRSMAAARRAEYVAQYGKISVEASNHLERSWFLMAAANYYADLASKTLNDEYFSKAKIFTDAARGAVRPRLGLRPARLDLRGAAAKTSPTRSGPLNAPLTRLCGSDGS